ncbi:hypothetical protein ARC02_10050 [Stenotrophomonas africana]|nr:hypothetical protein ARC02_10050 [Stenotrophomonas maltophilia]
MRSTMAKAMFWLTERSPQTLAQQAPRFALRPADTFVRVLGDDFMATRLGPIPSANSCASRDWSLLGIEGGTALVPPCH